MLERLKINWYPVQVPASELRLQARRLEGGEKPRFGRHVRQYEINGVRYAVVVAPGDPPPGCENVGIKWQEYPWIAQTLIYEAFYHTSGFRLRGGQEKARENCSATVSWGLPATLLF